MIGNGPDRAEIEVEIETLRLRDDVTLTGYVDRDDVLSFLRACELFVFASKTETQGLVLLEAMAMSTPVVAIDATGVHDLVGDNVGGVTTDDDADEFARTTVSLLRSPRLLRGKRTEAQRRASLWSIENQVRRLEAVYDAAITDMRRHGLPRYRRRRRY